MLRLVVIPNDPLTAYLEKGEVKERYFNPEDLFDEVHVISLTDRDASPAEVQAMAGRAELHIHAVGRPKPWALGRHAGRVARLIAGLEPDAIRAFNPLYMGRLASLAGRASGKPTIISVHDDFSLRRNLKIYGLGYIFSARGGYQLVHQLFFVRSMFAAVDKVVCAYPFAARWVDGYAREKREIILNRVYLDRFAPKTDYAVEGRFRVLNLGRQFPGKNPANMIRAAAEVDGLELTLVGRGPLHEELIDLARRLGLAERVNFIPAVANDEVPALMAEHDAFAMNLIQPGVCIPIIEALAAGLPVVTNRPIFPEGLDLVGEYVLQVEDSAKGYAEALAGLIADEGLRERLGRAGPRFVAQIEGRKMERREADLYRSLLGLDERGDID